MTANNYLDMIADLIWERAQKDEKEERKEILKQIMFHMANLLRFYCKQQGNDCERCVFVLVDPDRKACECKINIGKNAPGTAPRFWDLAVKRWDEHAKQKAQEPMQSGMSGQEAGMS